MGRKGKRTLTQVPAPTLAGMVVSNLVGAINTKLPAMSANYSGKLRAYAADTIRQGRARNKLATWYTVLMANSDRISDVYDDIRKNYKKSLKAGLGVAVPPVPVPAVAPTPTM